MLSAEGSAFSAGGNVKHMRDKTGTFAGGPATVRRRYIEGIQRVPKALYALDIPSIAAVQGPSIGAGCDLALYCDIIIASTQARFGKTLINVGMQRAAELIFTGRIVDGAEAAEIGMALECTEPNALLPRVTELAVQIAARPPVTARMVKTLLRQSQAAGLHDFLDNCAALQAICHTTDDHTEAVDALLEKREPVFKGI